MPYQPKELYIPQTTQIQVARFHHYADAYVLRPPYQRKTVWTPKQKQQLIDTLFRGYYVPHLVLREISVGKDSVRHEVIDGQQRINAVQEFMSGKLKMLKGPDARFSGKKYADLHHEIREFFDNINLSATLIKGIADKDNIEHHKIATVIFWRLQQGVSLKQIEVAHASITSRVRNFLVKYADDVSFDYEGYQAVDQNPKKHKIFSLIGGKNDRMQHLSLLGRLLLIEINDGCTDVGDDQVTQLVDETVADTVNDCYQEREATNLLKLLNKFCEVFEDDDVAQKGGYTWPDYLVISFYLLVRHIHEHYAWDHAKGYLWKFFSVFYPRRLKPASDDADMHAFRDSRQQSEADLSNRDVILRQLFFDFLRKEGTELHPLDGKRFFDEVDRIKIYREGNGICSMCQKEGVREDKCWVPWEKYEADHIIPWIEGGQTTPDNAQVLCRTHNRAKGGR